jgi:hypothetical protein
MPFVQIVFFKNIKAYLTREESKYPKNCHIYSKRSAYFPPAIFFLFTITLNFISNYIFLRYQSDYMKKEAGQHMRCYPAVYLNPTKPYIKY